MSASDILRTFAKLDMASHGSRRVLREFLRSPCYGYFLKTLQGSDILGYADFLDKAGTGFILRAQCLIGSSILKALDLIPTTDELWTSCLSALRQICGDRTILPTTHVLSRGLIKRGNVSMAIGGTGSCSEAQYKRRAVRVRSLQMPPASAQVLIKVVSYYLTVIPDPPLTDCEEVLLRGRTLEKVQSPERCLGLGRDGRPVPSRI